MCVRRERLRETERQREIERDRERKCENKWVLSFMYQFLRLWLFTADMAL